MTEACGDESHEIHFLRDNIYYTSVCVYIYMCVSFYVCIWIIYICTNLVTPSPEPPRHQCNASVDNWEALWSIEDSIISSLHMISIYIYIYNHNIRIYIYIYTCISGWWYTYPLKKYDFVSWDDEILMNGNIKLTFQTTNHTYIYIYIHTGLLYCGSTV